jgi:hypothetical protein
VFWSWRGLIRQRVVVNTAERAFAGILWAQRGPLLVLRDVEMHEPGAQSQTLDGEIIVERSRVEFIQVVGG